MVIDVIQTENAAAIVLRGRVDTLASPELERAVLSVPEGVAELTMDLAGVTYISSAGLRVLLGAHRLMEGRHGRLRLVNVGEPISGIFEVTGFRSILSIE